MISESQFPHLKSEDIINYPWALLRGVETTTSTQQSLVTFKHQKKILANIFSNLHKYMYFYFVHGENETDQTHLDTEFNFLITFQIAHIQTFMGIFPSILIFNKNSWNCQATGLRKFSSLLTLSMALASLKQQHYHLIWWVEDGWRGTILAVKEVTWKKQKAERPSSESIGRLADGRGRVRVLFICVTSKHILLLRW